MKLTPRERFLAKVCPEPVSGCWLWRGTLGLDGYGVANFEGHAYAAHRLAWMLFRSEILPGLVVCHKCDVRNCVNPDHLFLGTRADNARDMVEKGRSLSGEEHHNAKLTLEQVKQIKTMLAEDRMYMSEIAREYGVSTGTIARIAKGVSWRHVKVDSAPHPELNDSPAEHAKQEPAISDDDPNHEL